MKFRKYLSLVLAVMLFASLCVPASAAPANPPDAPTSTAAAVTATVVSGETMGPTISITATTGQAFINPYGLELTLGTTPSPTASTQARIISPLYVMENKTETPLKVFAEVTGTPGGECSLVQDAAQINAADTKKDAFMYVAFEAFDTEVTNNAALASSGKIPYAGTNSADGPVPIDTAYSLTSSSIREATVLVTTRASQTNTPILITKAALVSDVASEVAVPATKYVPNYICYRILGTANGNSKEQWVAADKVDTTITFSFVPVWPEPTTITAG